MYNKTYKNRQNTTHIYTYTHKASTVICNQNRTFLPHQCYFWWRNDTSKITHLSLSFPNCLKNTNKQTCKVNPQAASHSNCEKQPGRISASADPVRLHMCQYVNTCIWILCSVFVFMAKPVFGVVAVLLSWTWWHSVPLRLS